MIFYSPKFAFNSKFDVNNQLLLLSTSLGLCRQYYPDPLKSQSIFRIDLQIEF